jgi:hypothetical protein
MTKSEKELLEEILITQKDLIRIQFGQMVMIYNQMGINEIAGLLPKNWSQEQFKELLAQTDKRINLSQEILKAIAENIINKHLSDEEKLEQDKLIKEAEKKKDVYKSYV